MIEVDDCTRLGICGTKRTVQKMRGVCIYYKVGMFEVFLICGLKTTVPKIEVSAF